jgi:hypothetical protein
MSYELALKSQSFISAAFVLAKSHEMPGYVERKCHAC